MSVKLSLIDKKINYLKKQLHFLIHNRELTDTSVVKCSQKLDKLIVEYEKAKAFSKLQQ